MAIAVRRFAPQDRLSAGATGHGQMPVVALIDETAVGLAWGRQDEREPTIAHLFQVWASSEARWSCQPMQLELNDGIQTGRPDER